MKLSKLPLVARKCVVKASVGGSCTCNHKECWQDVHIKAVVPVKNKQ